MLNIIDMDFARQIRQARQQSGLSQAQLASRAGLGLATIQNIESNRANPAINTLLSIFKVLKIRLVLESPRQEIDWARLIHYGCPLMNRNSASETETRTKTGLIECSQTITTSHLNQREAKATAAWVKALSDHYPSTWTELPVALRSWAANQAAEPKLRRLALARLGEFL